MPANHLNDIIRSTTKQFMLFCVFGCFCLHVNAEQPQVIVPDFFEATYSIFHEGDPVGSMHRKFQTEDTHYLLHSISDIDGYYGLIPVSDKRVEVSRFHIDPATGRYTSIDYRMDRTGTWTDFVMQIQFEPTNNLVHLKYKQEQKTKELTGEILDNASYQLKVQQEIVNGNRDAIDYDIAYKTHFKNFNFVYVGEETINIAGKEVATLKYQRVRKNKKNKKQVYTWHAKDRNNVMLRLLYKNEKGKEEIRFDLKKYQPLH